jgi:hypothetical protein
MHYYLLTCLLIGQTYLPLCAQVSASKVDSTLTNDIIRLNEMRRIGAFCKDGTRSNSTGIGACATHGGVDYWLYTEEPLVQQFGGNLPAIPTNRLVPLRPSELRNALDLGVNLLPILRDELNRRREDIGGKDQPKYEKARPQAPKRNPEKATRKRWEVEDLLFYFVLFATLVLMFVILYVIIKKIL